MVITDLTNTSWVLKSGTINVSQLASSYDITTNIGSTLSKTSDTRTDIIGYTSWTELKISNTRLAFGSVHQQYVSPPPPNEVSRYYSSPITITGGTDATNSTLISWFQTYATRVDATFDLSTLGLSAGTYTITVKAKEPNHHRESPASNSATYTVT